MSRAHVTKILSSSDKQIVETTFENPKWSAVKKTVYQRKGTFHRDGSGEITVRALTEPTQYFPYTEMVSLGLRNLFTEYQPAFVGDGTYMISYAGRVMRKGASAQALWHCDGESNGRYFALFYGPGPEGAGHKVPVTAIAEVENPRSYSKLATPPPGGEFVDLMPHETVLMFDNERCLHSGPQTSNQNIGDFVRVTMTPRVKPRVKPPPPMLDAFTDRAVEPDDGDSDKDMWSFY